MNIRIVYLVGLTLLITFSLLHAGDMNAKDYADKFYAEWNVPREQGDDGAGMTVSRFHHDVPASLQVEVLDQILDHAISNRPTINYQVMGYVLMCIEKLGSEIILTPRLDTNLSALAKDSNWPTRRDVLQVLTRLKREKDHDLIVTALNDPKDEVRDAALDALRDRPNSEAIYQKFIQNHQSDSNYTLSVQSAKSGLEAIREKANGK